MSSMIDIYLERPSSDPIKNCTPQKTRNKETLIRCPVATAYWICPPEQFADYDV